MTQLETDLELLPELPRAAAMPENYDLIDLDTRIAFYTQRDRAIKTMGFVLLTAETVDALAELMGQKRVLEVGSGSGCLSQHLHNRGVNITAADIGERGWKFKVYRRDYTGDAVPLVKDYDIVLMCWPNYNNSFASRVAKAMRPGQALIYNGESHGGCTADDTFYEEMERPHWRERPGTSAKLNEHHRQWNGIHDYWTVWERMIP